MADELTPLTRIENFLAGNPQELEPLTRIESFIERLNSFIERLNSLIAETKDVEVREITIQSPFEPLTGQNFIARCGNMVMFDLNFRILANTSISLDQVIADLPEDWPSIFKGHFILSTGNVFRLSEFGGSGGNTIRFRAAFDQSAVTVMRGSGIYIVDEGGTNGI